MDFLSYRNFALSKLFYVYSHPGLSLLVFTVLILATSWLLKRTKKRLPASEIDLNKYQLSMIGVLLQDAPVIVKWLIIRILFYPSLAYNLFNHYTLPEGTHDWWNYIDKHVILGALPFHSTVTMLYKEGVRGVVNTCEEYSGPIKVYDRYNIKQLHVPVFDYTAPTEHQIDQAIAFIEKCIERNEKVYIHCKAGKGRSTTFAVCYLMKAHGITSQQALRIIIQNRPQVSKYIWRRACVIDFAKRHGLKTELDKEV